VDAGTPYDRCKKKALTPTLAKVGIFPNSPTAMSPDSAESNPSEKDSPKPLDLSFLGLGPSWVSGPAENVSSGRRENRDKGHRRIHQHDDQRRPPRRPEGKPSPSDRQARHHGRGTSREERFSHSPRQEENFAHSPVVSVGFFPDDAKFEVLGEAMKKSLITYELFSIAQLILDKEDRLSILIKPVQADKNPEATLSLSVPDGLPFLTEAEAVNHVMSRHLDKFFDTVEVDIEAPKGSFSMVARCPKSGSILGAPTHHHYQKNLREHHARYFPNVPFERFKAGLEMVRDQEAIDQWVKSMSKRLEYAPKDRKEGEPERLESIDAARGFLLAFRRDATVITRPQVRFPGRLLAEMPPGPLRDSIRHALELQRRFPLDTANGIRGRLRKEGFHLYKKGSKGITYACGVRRKCRDPKSTFSDSMQKILDCLDKTSGQQSKDVVAQVAGEGADDAAKSKVLADLNFLITEGYIAKLHDGRLFAQPILSSQAKAKEEAENEDSSEETK